MKASTLRLAMNLWPPFLFSGIRVSAVAADFTYARVELRQRWFNRNYVGTHFGGSLFAMADPFWMILLLRVLGREYYVWDKAARIEFLQPGRGTVSAEFRLDAATLAEIRAATAGDEKHLRWFETELRNGDGELVARVHKQLYVRRKPRDATGGSGSIRAE
jgi:acyl-coenzyme A thioesterase PaaI-like protein